MPMPNIGKILIIQLGDIGDVIWTTPTLWAVKRAYAHARVSILVREGYGVLIEGDPSLDKVFEVPRYKGGLLRQGRNQIRFLRALRQEGFSMVIDLRAGDRGAILAYLTGAPMRVSQHYDRGVPFWRKRLFTHIIYPPATTEKVRGAAEQSLRIVRGLGIESRDPIPRLWISAEADKRVQEILQNERMAECGNWITLNPFARWAYKEWNLERWAEIIDWLQDEYLIPTVIIGAPEERERAAALVKKCRSAVFNLAGKTPLRELPGLLRLSLLHIGVDSAAPHIAAAVGTPTITLYGPTDWYDWAPIGERHRVIVPDQECVPCQKKGCRDEGRSQCLDELKPEKVQAVIQQSLNQLSIRQSFT
jgi:heptosyltransferase-3